MRGFLRRLVGLGSSSVGLAAGVSSSFCSASLRRLTTARALPDPASLGGVDLQEPALDAGMFVHAGCGVLAVAGAQRDPAQEEVFIELFSFLGSRRTHLVVTAFAAAAFDEGVMGLDDLFRQDCGVTPGRFQVQMSQQR
jgi:hypothetical protein